MSTIYNTKFQINGVIDTSKTVMDNINTLCTSSGCWMTFDVNSGLWSVVINRAGTSVKSFNDSNIIGGINVSGKGINEYYNKVTIQYPNKDLRDQTDYIDLKIPDADRYPQELDNTLQITLDCINDPVAAQIIASQELKQNRVDKIIEFKTDYTILGLKAGDLIDVTNAYYGFTNKVFRITKIIEDDADSGELNLSITALEYSDSVYANDLIIEPRNKITGIVPKAANVALTASDNASTTQSLTDSLTGPAGLALLLPLLSSLAPKLGLGSDIGLSPLVKVFFVDMIVTPGDEIEHNYNLSSVQAPYTGSYLIQYDINWGGNFNPTPPLGIRKSTTIVVKRNGINVTELGKHAATGGQWVDPYEDHHIQGRFTANKGDTLDFSIDALNNYPERYNDTYLHFTPASGSATAMWISGTLFYTGN